MDGKHRNPSEAKIVVREVGAADIDLLMDWRMTVLDEVFADEKPWDAEGLALANRQYYEEHLGLDHIACIASVDGEDIACGAICLQTEMPSPDNPSGKSAYVMNMYTKPEFRHHGVASDVLRHLIARAQQLGAEKIYLEATDCGAPLYAELGFEQMQGMMKLK